MTLAHGMEFFKERNEPGDDVRAAVLAALLEGMDEKDIPLPEKEQAGEDVPYEDAPLITSRNQIIAVTALGNMQDDDISKNLQPRDYLFETQRRLERSNELQHILGPITLMAQSKLTESEIKERKWYGARKNTVSWQCNRTIANTNMIYDFNLYRNPDERTKIKQLEMKFGVAGQDNKLYSHSVLEIDMNNNLPTRVSLRFNRSEDMTPALLPALSATPALSETTTRNRILTQQLRFETRKPTREVYMPSEKTGEYITHSRYVIDLNPNDLSVKEYRWKKGVPDFQEIYDPQSDTYKSSEGVSLHGRIAAEDVTILTQALVDLIPTSERPWMQ